MYVKLKRVTNAFGFSLSNTSGNECMLDANEALGGQNEGFRPMELLAGALVGCMSIDIIHILKKKRIELSHFAVNVSETRKNTTPAPFESIHLAIEADKAVDKKTMEEVIQLSLKKYCSVAASLNPTIAITYEIAII
jgi:putative redox protein